MRDVVVVMAKKPEPGAVKTRLARTLGDEGACDLYRAFLRDLNERLRDGAWDLRWAVHPPGADLGAEIGAAVDALDQRGEDLAARMHNGFVDLCDGGAARVVMVGADAPHLSREVVAEAFARLDTHDSVFVPTRDGGYCLVGLRAPCDLFVGIPMSTGEVMERTLERADSRGIRVALLGVTFDVDEADDLRELCSLIESGAVSLPYTAAVLGKISRQ